MKHVICAVALAATGIAPSFARGQDATPQPPQLSEDRPLADNLELIATFYDAMPTGVTVSHGNRIFLNFPLWGDNVPFTVAELVHGKAVPYPSAEINDWPGRASDDPTTFTDQAINAAHFISVQSVVVDPADRLWVLDTGSPLQKGALPGGPKLVAIDLATNKVLKTILLPPEVAGTTSYMNDVRFDLSKGNAIGAIQGTAYITDSSSQGPNAIVVVDLSTGRSWRRLNNHPSTRPDPGFIGFFEGRPMYHTSTGKPPERILVGADGIALSRDGSQLFYCPLSSTRLYSVSATALRDQSIPDAKVAETVRLVTGKGPSDGLEADAEGNVYAGDYSTNSIIRISSTGMVETLLHDPRLLWPDTLSLSDDGYLYITANQLPRQAAMHNGKDERVKPYALFRIKVDAKPVRLK
jgi:sugar lactone lactonase YvrE